MNHYSSLFSFIPVICHIEYSELKYVEILIINVSWSFPNCNFLVWRCKYFQNHLSNLPQIFRMCFLYGCVMTQFEGNLTTTISVPCK